MKAELVVVNGRIHTLESASPLVEGLATAGGRVVATGDRESLRAWIGRGTEVLDLAGRIALPGLTDAHVHLLAYGLSLRQVDLSGARSPQQAADRVRQRAATAPPGEWIRGRGWDRNLWSPPDFPRRQTLDEAAPQHPVALSAKDGHALWLNSLGLERAGVGMGEVDRWGAQVVRDRDTGEAIGVLLEDAAGEALQRIGKPGPEVLREAAMLAAEEALRLGVAGVHDCEEGEELAALSQLWRQRKLPLRVYMLIPHANLEAAISLGLQTGFGDEWLRIGHLKLFADGSLGSRTAAMLEPYASEPENCGLEVLSAEELQALVARASRAGIAAATHAIGDRANRQVLEAYAATRTIWGPLGLRPRIEHAQVLAPDDLPRLAAVGAVASMQPIHATSDWEMAEAYWGARSASAYAWRSLADSGAILAFGSDCPVESLDPLAGIHAAVTRQRPDGTPAGGWRPEECLTVAEAVRAYTWGAAYAAGEENAKGSLAPGKVGDLVVLSEDIYRVSPSDIPAVRVVGTIVGGRVAYDGGL